MALLRGRGCLVALAILVLLAVAALVAVRLALDPDRLRAIAESRLSDAFDRPVRIGSMATSLFPRPHVEGQAITIGEATSGRPAAIGLDRIRIVPRITSLFSTPIVIERLELEGLTVEVRRQHEGEWLLPIPPAATGGGEEGGERFNVERLVLRGGRVTMVDERAGSGVPPGTIHDIEAVARREGETTHLESLTGKVGESTLAGSGVAGPDGLRLRLAWTSLAPADVDDVFALGGMKPPPGLAIEGERPLAIDLHVPPSGEAKATGRLAASRVTFTSFTLSSLTSPLTLADGVLTLRPLQFEAYGGRMDGALTAEVLASPATWRFDGRGTGVDMARLVSDATTMGEKLAGTAAVEAHLRGGGSSIVALTGTVAIDIASGAIRQFPLLAALNSVLKIEEEGTEDFNFDTMTASLALNGTRVAINDLLARAGTLTVTGTGVLENAVLQFSGVAAFSREKSQELIRRVHELSGMRNRNGEIEVPFGVTGPLAAPQFSIDMGRILGRAAEEELKRQINRKLKELLGGIRK